MGQQLRIAQETTIMVGSISKVVGEHDDCGVIQLDMCPQEAVSLLGIF